MERKLNTLKVALLATSGFEEVELTEPRNALDEAGATTQIVSPKSGSIIAWDKDDWGGTYHVDVSLDEANADDFDALVLPGGVLNPDHLRINEKAVAFTKAFFDAGKPVAAICHGPWTLIEAGVVEGRRMTSYKSIKTDLVNAGANWVDDETVVDGNLLTSRHPDDLPAFNEAMLKLIAETRTGEPVAG